MATPCKRIGYADLRSHFHDGMSIMFGGFMGVLLLPILYGVCGFLGGLIHAWVYNVAAGWVGGVRIEVE